jgi:hypothetical protein
MRHKTEEMRKDIFNKRRYCLYRPSDLMPGPIRRRIFDHFLFRPCTRQQRPRKCFIWISKIRKISPCTRHLISVNNKLRRMFFARTIKGSKCGDGSLGRSQSINPWKIEEREWLPLLTCAPCWYSRCHGQINRNFVIDRTFNIKETYRRRWMTSNSDWATWAKGADCSSCCTRSRRHPRNS